MSNSVIRNWLKFLDAEVYAESFIDNGYDDLETINRIEREDLEAIGVIGQEPQDYLLAAVKVLKEEGGAWVYLLYCDTSNCADDKVESDNDYCQSDKNFYGSSGPESYKSSIYPNSDETVSEESSREDRKFSKTSTNHFRDKAHSGKGIQFK